MSGSFSSSGGGTAPNAAHHGQRSAPHPLYDEESLYNRLRSPFGSGDKLRGYFHWLNLVHEMGQGSASGAGSPGGEARPLRAAVTRSAVAVGSQRIDRSERGDDQFVVELAAAGYRGRRGRLLLFDPRVCDKLCARIGLDPVVVDSEEFLRRALERDVLEVNTEVAQILSAVPDLDSQFDATGIRWSAPVPRGSRPLPPGTIVAAITDQRALYLLNAARNGWTQVAGEALSSPLPVRFWRDVVSHLAAAAVAAALVIVLRPGSARPPEDSNRSEPGITFVAGPAEKGVSTHTVVRSGYQFTANYRWPASPWKRGWLFVVDRAGGQLLNSKNRDQGTLELTYENAFDDAMGAEFFVFIAGNDDAPFLNEKDAKEWLTPERLVELQKLSPDGRDKQAADLIRKALEEKLGHPIDADVRVLSVDHR